MCVYIYIFFLFVSCLYVSFFQRQVKIENTQRYETWSVLLPVQIQCSGFVLILRDRSLRDAGILIFRLVQLHDLLRKGKGKDRPITSHEGPEEE